MSSSEQCVKEARQAMGTRFEVALPGDDLLRLLPAAESALDEVERLERQLSMYRYESEISGINAYAGFQPVRVEPRLFALLRRAQQITRETGGAFDLTVGPLLRAWGFVGGSGAMAEPEAVEAARELVGADRLLLDSEAMTVTFDRPGVLLDLGAIGKGYALDRALEMLEDAGVDRALVHGGTSTVYGLGAPPDSAGWRVALRDPRGEADAVLGTVELRDRALSVSAPHGKAFREGDRLYGHVLDPRTGEPVHGAMLAAVAHPSATLTDALSTALLVLGRDGVPGLAALYPEADLLVVAEEAGGPRAWAAGPDGWRLRLLADGIPVERLDPGPSDNSVREDAPPSAA